MVLPGLVWVKFVACSQNDMVSFSKLVCIMYALLACAEDRATLESDLNTDTGG